MTFTYEELKSWILQQPLDRKIDMTDNRADTCGCILTQFAAYHRPNLVPRAGWTNVGLYLLDTANFVESLETPDKIKLEEFISRALNCQVTKYSEVLHLL